MPKIKDIYYKGKTYTSESLKRQLIKEGKIKPSRETIYHVNDADIEYAWFSDWSDLLEYMQDNDLIEDTEAHYDNCDGLYPEPHDIPEKSCKDCPHIKDCKEYLRYQ